MSIDKNVIICIKIDNPGDFLVKNEKYMFNEVTNTYQVLFNMNDINDKYIKLVSDNRFNLHIPMKKNGCIITVVISVNYRAVHGRTRMIKVKNSRISSRIGSPIKCNFARSAYIYCLV